MKIQNVVLQNVLSYRERTEFSFDSQLNILIGPNGGGKSNLQKIIALALSRYFVYHYDFQRDDNGARIAPFDPWRPAVLARNLPKFADDESDQCIELVLIPEPSDLKNIEAIGANLAKFNKQLTEEWSSPHESYPPAKSVAEIESASSLTYKIRNHQLEEVSPEPAASAFRQYLNTFNIFKRLSARLPEVELSTPVFFFSSDRAVHKNIDIQMQQLTTQQYYQGYRSADQAAMGETTNLLPWGTQHFARLRHRAWEEAGDTGHKKGADILALHPDVVLLNRYLRQLGYEWVLQPDDDKINLTFALVKGDEEIPTSRFSSGEREIVHFLLAMFALNVKDGLVLVDEPELHLHPRWQRIFLGLFRDLAKDRSDQLIISTHSSIFVTPDTISDISRIYRAPGRGSAVVTLGMSDLPKKKHLVQIINSQNNERLFFADTVVLVEGITDRLIFTSLIDAAAAYFGNYDAVEVIEVRGKTNFVEYTSLLQTLKARSLIVADQGYLSDVGSAATKALFVTDPQKQWEALTKGRPSQDAATMITRLDEAIHTKDLTELTGFYAYFTTRHRRLKNPLSDQESATLDSDLGRLRSEGTFVLRHGSIEAYLPPGVSGVEMILDMLTKPNWINDVADERCRLELGEIVCAVLNISDNRKERLELELKQRRVNLVRQTEQPRHTAAPA